MDVFSTVASAYTLAKELYNYFDVWKDCPSDVAELGDELLWLSRVLQIVEKILNNPILAPDLVERAQEAMTKCSGALQELEAKITIIRKERNSQSKRAEIRDSFQRSLYPFTKSTVKRLSGDVAECGEQLDTVVELLNLDNGLRVADLVNARGDELKAFLSTVRKTISDQAAAEQKNHTALHAQYGTIKDDLNALGISAAQAKDLNQNEDVILWLSPPNPKPVDIDQQEPDCNAWLLQSSIYQSW